MTKIYDASQEFKPFANRGLGGALLEERKYNGHPNKKGWPRKNTSRHAPNSRIRVSEHGDIRNGYTWVKV